MINYILGTLIFGYAGWTIYKHIKKSKKGKCAACELKEYCLSKSRCGKKIRN